GIIAGATGSGKTRAAVVLLREIFESITETVCGIGIIDLKGEFFAHAYAKCKSSEGLHVLDLSHGAVIPYDLLMPQNGESPNELIARRMETLRDLLDSSDTSQRMYRMLRFLLTLLVESDLSFAALDHIIETPELAVRLAAKSNNDRLKRYFRDDFLKEKSVTLPALHYRLDPLLTPESVRFSLSAGEQFDFRAAMDNGEPALTNLSGAGNHASKIFQSLILSDLRQTIFTLREVNVPYLWFCDEAQLLFRRQSDKENLSTIFSLARSYGAHVTLITQSLRSAIGDSDLFENLETNFRWLLLLRSGQSDAAIIRPGLRAT